VFINFKDNFIYYLTIHLTITLTIQTIDTNCIIPINTNTPYILPLHKGGILGDSVQDIVNNPNLRDSQYWGVDIDRDSWDNVLIKRNAHGAHARDLPS